KGNASSPQLPDAGEWRPRRSRTVFTARRRHAGFAAVRRRQSPRPARAEKAASSAEGEISHLSVYGRRPQPPRHFRPEAEAARTRGKPMPESFGRPITAMGTASNNIIPSQRTFKPYGQSGIPVSDWLPFTAEHVDDLAVIRSCWADGLNH